MTLIDHALRGPVVDESLLCLADEREAVRVSKIKSALRYIRWRRLASLATSATVVLGGQHVGRGAVLLPRDVIVHLEADRFVGPVRPSRSSFSSPYRAWYR